MILTIREKVTLEQLRQMLEEHGKIDYVKFAVDVEQGILAGGGEWHSDCEEVLLEQGSEQRNVWGAGWTWKKREVAYDSQINIRPRADNRSNLIEDESLRERVKSIILQFFDGVEP